MGAQARRQQQRRRARPAAEVVVAPGYENAGAQIGTKLEAPFDAAADGAKQRMASGGDGTSPRLLEPLHGQTETARSAGSSRSSKKTGEK